MEVILRVDHEKIIYWIFVLKNCSVIIVLDPLMRKLPGVSSQNRKYSSIIQKKSLSRFIKAIFHNYNCSFKKSYQKQTA
jgi:hypothetical protein